MDGGPGGPGLAAQLGLQTGDRPVVSCRNTSEIGAERRLESILICTHAVASTGEHGRHLSEIKTRRGLRRHLGESEQILAEWIK